MDNKNWTDQLPDLLQEFQESAPEGLWDAVQAGLAKRRRQRVAWWISGAVAAAAAVVLAVFLWPAAPSVTLVPGADKVAQAIPETEVPMEPVVPEAPDAPVAVTAETAPAAPVAKPAARPASAPAAATETMPVAAPETEPDAALVTELATEPVNQPEAGPTTAPVTQPETEPATAPATQPAAKPATEPAPQPVVIPLEQQIRRRSAAGGGLRLALRTEGCLSPSQTLTSAGYGLPASSATLPGGISLRMLNRNQASTSESVHSQSARVSLGVQYAFLPRLAVETGLSLTTLHSTITTETGTAQSSSMRRMQYLGVPLMLHFDALEWWRLGFYLQAGPMYEWCIGTQTTEISGLGERLLDDTQSKQRVEDGIWSLQTAAGVQLRLFQHGALFVQPGFSWHFPGTGTVENYYTTHPAAFSLSFGFRFLL